MKIIGYVLVLIIVCVVYYCLIKKTISQVKENAPIINDALKKALKINELFENAEDAFVMILTNKIDDADATPDSQSMAQDPFIYFRVHFFNVPWETIDYIRDSSNEETIAVMDRYLMHTYHKTDSEIREIGVSPYRLIYDLNRTNDKNDGILYYPFLCPCNLRGGEKNAFINEIKRQSKKSKGS